MSGEQLLSASIFASASVILLAIALFVADERDPGVEPPIPREVAEEVVTRMGGHPTSAAKATKWAVEILHERNPVTADGSPAPQVVYGAAVRYASGAVDWDGFLDLIGYDEIGKANGRR